MLVEAFPAAQLRHRGLPHQGYSAQTGAAKRELIITALASRVSLQRAHVDLMLSSTDALDAVIAIFAAVSVFRGLAAHPPEAEFEGAIAVHP
jgi:hypothetical protein